MRPPSYYTSLANSNSSSANNRSNSSQQLRSSFSSSSSTSYATRTHLPFVPQTMLVAHCYTGVGSSTKPYGQSTSSSSGIYSSNRLGSTASSYSSSGYSSRPLSTKRHHQLSSSSSSTSSYTTTPRSSYLNSVVPSSTTSSSSYRRPSAYTYQPIRLRERPLLTRLSNQLNTGAYRYDTSTRPPGGSAGAASKPPLADSRETSCDEAKRKDQQQQQQQQDDWSSDVARNISRNKYLIKFREIDKPRAPLPIVPSQDNYSSQTPKDCKNDTEQQDISVTVRLQIEPKDMRVNDHQSSTLSVVNVVPATCVGTDDVANKQQLEQPVVEKDDCDRTAVVTKETTKDKEIKRAKVPRDKRNIKLKIKNVSPVNNDKQDSAATVDQSAIGLATATTRSKKKTPEPSSQDTNSNKDAASSSSSPQPTTKTKVKRLVKSKLASEQQQPGDKPAIVMKKPEQPKSELKAKDSLMTKRLSDRKVLSPKQLDLSCSKETPTAKKAAAAEVKELSPIKTGNNSDSPKSATDSTTSKRIRFREYNYEDFNFLSVLGHGGWGFVILAELKNHEACFAVKCIKKITIVEDDDFDSIMIERKVLTLGNIHPFICKLFCTFETEGYLFFAMEYCAGGDLMFHVQREGKFSEARSRFYAAEIICAIKFLHNQHIIYRDLKLDNILLDSSGHIRLVDFGMCQCRTYREEMLPSNFCGTPEYISPEIIKGVPYNHSVDWWSFGVLLYEMAVGKMPFRGNDENELLWNVCYEQIHYPMFLTKELTSLLQSLLEREPTKRMGMSTCKAGDIYDQAWFKGVDWRAIEELRVPPPFVPDVTSERDVQNFDSDFTQSTPELSPVDEGTLKKIDQSQFQKFPYTNPNISIFG